MGPYCPNKAPSNKPPHYIIIILYPIAYPVHGLIIIYIKHHQPNLFNIAHMKPPGFSNSHPALLPLVPRQSFWNCVNTFAVPYDKRGADTRHFGAQIKERWETNSSTPIKVEYLCQHLGHSKGVHVGCSQNLVFKHGVWFQWLLFSSKVAAEHVAFIDELIANTTGNHSFTLKYIHPVYLWNTSG